jgi:hypothetical protein
MGAPFKDEDDTTVPLTCPDRHVRQWPDMAILSEDSKLLLETI